MRFQKIAAVLFFSIFGLGIGSQAAAAPKSSVLAAIDQPRYTQELTEITDSQTRSDTLCLALNLYHEIRGTKHSQRDIAAVGWATRNRVESPVANGRDYCEIIWERGQFSWTVRATNTLMPREIAEWNRMVRISIGVIDGSIADPTSGANTFYISSLGTPSWTRRGTGRMTVGPHTFVRLPNR